jgi:arylformamidase
MKSTAQFDYVQGQMRPSFEALLAAYETEGRAATASESCALDLRYGPLQRQTFDFFAARGRARGTLAYFHAGYWQSRDKSGFRFIAPAFTAAGLNVALVNYPLCPTVSLAELVAAAHASVPAIRAHAAAGASADASHPLVVAGHSAGGHIAVELALSQPPSPAPPIAGIVALSGIFDLAPLVETTLNDRLRLDEAGAVACSPLHRVRGAAVPALFAVGDAETRAFGRQSARLHEAWREAGNRSALHVEAEADHFSLLRPFATSGAPLFGQVLALFD